MVAFAAAVATTSHLLGWSSSTRLIIFAVLGIPAALLGTAYAVGDRHPASDIRQDERHRVADADRR
jgi:hypothetical protein